jgi:hypothetical protein
MTVLLLLWIAWQCPVPEIIPPAHGQVAPPVPVDVSSTRSLSVAMATDVITQWKQHQHLYVKGDPGVSQEQLDGLEVWLDQNAPNWTVVLAESAAGEDYTTAEGRRFSGLDAVDEALGRGLPNRTSFGQQADPRTKEPNGAFFVLYLKDRKFSYFGSDAQDRRGLGEDRWQGNLDRPAFAAMRSGGRVVDAVKDTITNINRQLDQKISAEIAARDRKLADEQTERTRSLERAKAGLKTATDAFVLLEQKVGDLSRERPNLSGDLARPDFAQIRAELQMAQSALAGGDLSRVTGPAQRVRERAESLIRMIDEYRVAPEKLDRVARGIDEQARRKRAQSAAQQLGSAREALGKARHEHDRGDSSYAAHLETAQVALASADTAISTAIRNAANTQRFVAFSSLMALAALGALGWALNRRRLKSKNECLELLKIWESGLGEKNVALFELLDRTSTVVGASSDEAAKRYSGETRLLSEQIVKDVDELFIMSACTGRVLRDAQSLAQPQGALQKSFNLFATGKYDAAIKLLRDQPIAFRPDEALELVVRGPKTEHDTLLGHLESYKPFTMTFTQLIEAFNQRAGRALSSLDAVESSVINAGKSLEGVQTAIDQARAKEEAISNQAATDGLFRLPLVFTQLLPAAQSAQSEAVKIAIKDPVGALRTFGAEAKQRAGDALALAEVILEYRNDLLPGIRNAADALNTAGLSNQWVGGNLERLSAQADRLAEQALKVSASQAILLLKDALAKLAGRVECAAKLDQVRRETAQKAIDGTNATIEAARGELAAASGKEPGRILRESGADPSDYVRQAIEEIVAVKALLERGDTEAAQGSLDAIGRLTDEALNIVKATRQAFADQETTVSSRRAETERVAGAFPRYDGILAGIMHGYAPSVLTLGAGDPTHANANGTIEDNMDEAREHLAAARKLLDKSIEAFRDARVLEAAELLRQIKERQETAVFRLEEITEKQSRLTQAEEANQKLLAQLEAQLQQYEPLIHDDRTMAPTMQMFDDARHLVRAARTLIESSQKDPFQAAQELATALNSINESVNRAQCDHEVFAEAERSLQSASAQIESARRLATEAATDNIGDSIEINQANREVSSLTVTLGEAQADLKRPHGDWTAVDAEADRIAAEASRHAATLRRELKEAEAAVTALSTAASAIRSASVWAGSYGVAIGGRPGSDYLAQARDLLVRGSYAGARQAAQAAYQMATDAVAAAEAEVRRLRRAEEEQIERERRRRREEEAARQRRQSSSSNSFGSSGGSSFSSGSGVSRSSSSSGSGVSRSGW